MQSGIFLRNTTGKLIQLQRGILILVHISRFWNCFSVFFFYLIYFYFLFYHLIFVVYMYGIYYFVWLYANVTLDCQRSFFFFIILRKEQHL